MNYKTKNDTLYALRYVPVLLLALCSLTYAGDRVRFGLILLEPALIGTGHPPKANVFDGAYAYGDTADAGSGVSFAGGLSLQLRATNNIALGVEANYRWLYMFQNIYSGGSRSIDTIGVGIFDQTINVPIYFRVGQLTGEYCGYFDAGIVWGIPISSTARVSNKRLDIDDRISDFRAENDMGIIAGFGMSDDTFKFGFRVIIAVTRLAKDRTISAPSIVSMYLGIPIFKL